jgi:uncharacterized protein (DUF4415 family)
MLRYLDKKEIANMPKETVKTRVGGMIEPAHPEDVAPEQEMVTINLDEDVIAALKATGKGWQARTNGIVREWAKTHGIIA